MYLGATFWADYSDRACISPKITPLRSMQIKRVSSIACRFYGTFEILPHHNKKTHKFGLVRKIVYKYKYTFCNPKSKINSKIPNNLRKFIHLCCLVYEVISIGMSCVQLT